MSGLEIVGALLDAHAPFGSLVPVGNFDFWELPQGTGLNSVVAHRLSRIEVQFLSAQSQTLVTERIQCTVRAGSGAAREAVLTAIRDGCRDKTGTIAGKLNVSVLLAGDGPDFKDDDAAIYMGSTDLRVSFTEPA